MCVKTMPNSKNKNSASLTPQQADNSNNNSMPMNHHQHHHTISMVVGKKRRRRCLNNVRFELEDHDDDMARLQGQGERVDTTNKRTRVLELLPLSSEYSLAEKQIRWISSQEKEATSRLASLQAKVCRLQDAQREQENAAAIAALRGLDKAAETQQQQQQQQQQHCCCHPSYRETYTNIFSACYQQQQQQQQTAETSFMIATPQALALLAVQQDDIRGLEDRTVPLIALLRRKIRRMVIDSVLLAQHKQKGNANNNCSEEEEEEEHVAALGDLSRSLTQPAVQFARALGLADALSAMMECNNMNNNNNSSNSGSSSNFSLLTPKSQAPPTTTTTTTNSC